MSENHSVPSVLWHGWASGEHLACKNWVMRYWCGYLSGVRCKWLAYGPADATATLLSLASVKSRYLVPAFPDCPGKEAVKWVSVCLGSSFKTTKCHMKASHQHKVSCKSQMLLDKSAWYQWCQARFHHLNDGCKWCKLLMLHNTNIKVVSTTVSELGWPWMSKWCQMVIYLGSFKASQRKCGLI